MNLPPDCTINAGRAGSFMPFATNAPVKVTDGVNTETVTPSAVTYNGTTCSITATFSHAYAAGAKVSSGTAGLQEAINDTPSTGSVWVTPGSGVTSAFILAAAGNANVGIRDVSGAAEQDYTWSGSAYVASAVGGVASVTASSPIASRVGRILAISLEFCCSCQQGRYWRGNAAGRL